MSKQSQGKFSSVVSGSSSRVVTRQVTAARKRQLTTEAAGQSKPRKKKDRTGTHQSGRRASRKHHEQDHGDEDDESSSPSLENYDGCHDTLQRMMMDERDSEESEEEDEEYGSDGESAGNQGQNPGTARAHQAYRPVVEDMEEDDSPPQARTEEEEPEGEGPPVDDGSNDPAPDRRSAVADGLDGAMRYNWGASTNKSFQNSKKHFNIFLDKWKDHEDNSVRRQVLFGDRYPSYKNLALEKVDSGLMDQYALYLAKASWLGDKKKLLSCNTADRMFSAMHVGIAMKLMADGKTNPAISGAALRASRRGMINLFVDRAIRRNEKISKSHTAATQADPCWTQFSTQHPKPCQRHSTLAILLARQRIRIKAVLFAWML